MEVLCHCVVFINRSYLPWAALKIWQTGLNRKCTGYNRNKPQGKYVTVLCLLSVWCFVIIVVVVIVIVIVIVICLSCVIVWVRVVFRKTVGGD